VVKKADREIVHQIDAEFSCLIKELKDLARSVPLENVVRSAAVIEQMCGGLIANLWDDPLEWTLPETLSNPDRVVEYLSEVDFARRRAFDAMDDASLMKNVQLPSGKSQLLVDFLLETLVKASEFRGRASVLRNM